MSYNLATGYSSYPLSMAQLGEVGLLVNGIDANKILDLRTGQLKTLGMAAPGAAPATATSGTGYTATFRYRVRWVDSSTNTVSLPSAEVEQALVSQGAQITQPAGAPSRASHWLIERTTNGGRDFLPLNVTDAAPYGTAIGTATYVDGNGGTLTTDGTLRNRYGEAYDEVQGQPANYAHCWANGSVLWMCGGTVHSFSGSITGGSVSAALTGTGFTSDMVGWDVTFDDDTDGVSYKILTYTNSTSVTLASNYAGSTKSSASARVSPPNRQRVAWSETNEPESWGEDEVGGLSYQYDLMDDGEPVVTGIGLGLAGSLICKETRMYIWSYRNRPELVPGGDGRIVTLQSNRGACGKQAVCRVGQYVFGMDTVGCWVMDGNGGEPRDITGDIQNDWRNLIFSKRSTFFITHDDTRQEVYFHVVDVSTDSYPKQAFVFDLTRMAFTGTKPSRHAGRTCGVQLPDSQRAPRCACYTEVVGSAYSYLWFMNIGTSWGAGPAATPLVGTVSQNGSSTTARITSGNFTITGEKLKGVPMTLVRAADLSEETKIITDNDADDLTFNALSGTAPVTGDTVIVGPIPASWKTGRLNAGDATRKKTWQRVYVWLQADTSAHDLKVRAYFDGSSTPHSDRTLALDEDGVDIDAAVAGVAIDPADSEQRYYVPLDNIDAVDVELEFYSSKSGQPWQILDVQIEYEMDESEDPRKT